MAETDEEELALWRQLLDVEVCVIATAAHVSWLCVWNGVALVDLAPQTRVHGRVALRLELVLGVFGLEVNFDHHGMLLAEEVCILLLVHFSAEVEQNRVGVAHIRPLIVQSRTRTLLPLRQIFSSSLPSTK